MRVLLFSLIFPALFIWFFERLVVCFFRYFFLLYYFLSSSIFLSILYFFPLFFSLCFFLFCSFLSFFPFVLLFFFFLLKPSIFPRAVELYTLPQSFNVHCRTCLIFIATPAPHLSLRSSLKLALSLVYLQSVIDSTSIIRLSFFMPFFYICYKILPH